MKLNTLDRATSIYQRVKKLDEDITLVIEMLKRVEKEKLNVLLSFKFAANKEDLKEKEEKNHFPSYLSFMSESPKYETPKVKICPIVEELEDIEAIFIINSLLQIKREERKQEIQKIKDLGYE